MIVPSGAVRVLLATRPVEFRKGMDGRAALVRDWADSGVIHVFRGKASRSREDTIPGSNVGGGGRRWGAEWCQWTRKPTVSTARFDPKVDERGTLQNSNFQFSFGKLLGFGDITMA
jgi:hypothetical protein